MSASRDDDDEAAALLARLQAQFGDIDIQNLVEKSTSDDKQSKRASEDNAVGTIIGGLPRNDPNGDDDDEESSVEEPSPEELLRWQQAQYKMAKWGKNGGNDQGGKGNGGNGESDEEWICVEGPPDIGDQDSAFFLNTCLDSGTDKSAEKIDPLLKSLSAANAVFGGKWKRLYSSNHEGLSYATLVSCLRGYKGPTVLLVGAIAPPSPFGSDDTGTNPKSNAVIGFYSSTPWKDSMLSYGSRNCFLFRFDEGDANSIQIFRPIASNHEMKAPERELRMNAKRNNKNMSYQFCFSTIAAAVVADGGKIGPHPGQDQLEASGFAVPPGLGAGGGRGCSCPRLHITETLLDCKALPYDQTFEPGPLLPAFFGDNPTHSFDVDVMEAWGVGGGERIEAALKARDTERSFKEAHRKKNAEVDRAQFVDHFKSDMVHCKAFAHARHTSGRVDDCELESDGGSLSHLG